MIFAMASPWCTKVRGNTKKRWTGMDSADSFLPFQDWRWLVTRRAADEKPMIADGEAAFGAKGLRISGDRTNVTAN
ncbi:hypothetical protein [Mesorhizobium sanjuanii]|uniref:hypothetical protein n=1 Tax=Mesorhizobium sanjuanii TaxID=2037900 RepID=UPI0010548FC2|nr:hypothetical protein [Mesorhizobium sanjuanii]